MNILIDIRPLLDKPFTGVAQYTLNFLEDLFEKDNENNYFLFYNSFKVKNSDLPSFNYPNVKIVDFHWPNKIFNFFLCFFKWPKIDKLVEKKIGQEIDEIFLPNFNFYAFSKNKKIILVVHDLSFEIYPHFFNLKQRLWHKLIQPKKFSQRATKIITHSENTKNDLIKFYKIDPTKIEVRKPPISKSFKQPITKNELIRVKDKYKLSDNFILYLGKLEPRKNLKTLIYAFSYILDSKHFSDYNLVIAGSGRQILELKKLAKKLKVGGQIKFLGYVQEEDKKALYHLAKVFVFPSFYEGYGYPVVEALSCQLPVIISSTSSLTEIESDKIIFINPYELSDLIKAIKNLNGTF